MSSSGPQLSTSIPLNSGIKRKATAMIQSKHAKFFTNCQPQEFILPDSIMFYMANNPKSDDFYEKMIQTCKYFFIKNPILVTSKLAYSGDDKWQISLKQHQIDLSKLTSKIWINDRFVVIPEISFSKKAVIQNILACLLPKIYRCNAKYVSFDNQIISLYDLPFLFSSAEIIYFFKVNVKDKNGANVPMEKIVEVAVKAKKIEFGSYPYIISETMKELLKIPHFSKLDQLFLVDIPESFDLETFYFYMKKNKTTKFRFYFDNFVSEAFKKRLEEIIDEILAAETFDYKPPCIYFPGHDEEKYIKLKTIYFTRY